MHINRDKSKYINVCQGLNVTVTKLKRYHIFVTRKSSLT